MTKSGIKAKIRGIYSTALTKVLLDNGQIIVQPSVEIVDRLGLESLDNEPDLIIIDRNDRQGVKTFGDAEAIEAFSSILKDELVDVILRRRVDENCLDIEFPWTSKIKLDEFRRAVLPTAHRHHYLKACGGEISTAVNMAERLILQGRSSDKVEEQLRQTVELYLPIEGFEIVIEHVKLSGGTLSLGKAVIEEYNGRLIKYTREMRSNGVYDGLDITKEAGDLAKTEAKLGEYYVVTKYFSKRGKFKGAYININTPIEVYPTKIRYVDLEVDVCVDSGGRIKVVDEERLERAALMGVISEELLKKVKEKTEHLTYSDMRRFMSNYSSFTRS